MSYDNFSKYSKTSTVQEKKVKRTAYIQQHISNQNMWSYAYRASQLQIPFCLFKS